MKLEQNAKQTGSVQSPKLKRIVGSCFKPRHNIFKWSSVRYKFFIHMYIYNFLLLLSLFQSPVFYSFLSSLFISEAWVREHRPQREATRFGHRGPSCGKRSRLTEKNCASRIPKDYPLLPHASRTVLRREFRVAQWGIRKICCLE